MMMMVYYHYYYHYYYYCCYHYYYYYATTLATIYDSLRNLLPIKIESYLLLPTTYYCLPLPTTTSYLLPSYLLACLLAYLPTYRPIDRLSY